MKTLKKLLTLLTNILKMSVGLYNKNLNIEFYHIPKNGMTTMLRVLKFSWEDYNQIPNDRKIITIIRDPVDRFISSYIHFIKHYQGGNTEQTFRKINVNKKNLINNNYTNCLGIETFLIELEENGFFDNHNLPQISYLEGTNLPGKIFSNRSINKITNFIKFDTINEDLSEVLNKDITLPIHNKGNDNIRRQIENCVEDFRNRIEKLYKEDYNLYKKIL